MKVQLGWFPVALLLLWAGVGEAEENLTSSEKDPVTATAKAEGYRFDADRFARAMDRASGAPTDSSPETNRLAAAETGLGSVLGRTFISLIVVIGAIYGLTYLLRKLSIKTPFQTKGPLRVLAKQGLSQKSSVYIVSTLNRFLIIGESAQGLTCLSQLTDPDEIEALKQEWGWDEVEGSEPRPSLAPKKSVFAPALRSHMEDIERELREYEEVRR